MSSPINLGHRRMTFLQNKAMFNLVKIFAKGLKYRKYRVYLCVYLFFFAPLPSETKGRHTGRLGRNVETQHRFFSSVQEPGDGNLSFHGYLLVKNKKEKVVLH